MDALKPGIGLLCCLALAACALPLAGICARADEEPSAIIELGTASQWSLTGGHPAYGPNIGIETTPIPDILEVEADVTPFFSHGQTEWDTDFLFKKPFDLTDTLELMAGVGPEWAHSVSHGTLSDTISAEAALDFMYWPMPARHFGFYLEPAYDYDFGRGHEQSVGMSFGITIPIP